MTRFLDHAQRQELTAVCALLVPADEDGGAVEAGAVEYIDILLSAFLFDPPRIWAGGPFSGRMGGGAGFTEFLELTPYEELAWRTRIEGSRGIPERERLGPVMGLQVIYQEGLAVLGSDFTSIERAEQLERLRANPIFVDIVYRHVCEGMYGAPEYGGNKDLRGWAYTNYPGDTQPRGYSDAEVSGR